MENKAKEIEYLVNRLRMTTDEGEIIDLLQTIGVTLLNKYVVEINDVLIEPLLLEAYYFDEDTFRDCNTYGACDLDCRKKQSNRFNKLFVHPSKYSKGIDIVLSMEGNYCLSYLIKNSLIFDKRGDRKPIGCSQEKLCYELEKSFMINLSKIESNTNVLVDKSIYDLTVTRSDGLYAKRKGTTKGNHFNDRLACVLLDKIKDFSYSFEKGYSKTFLLREYMNNHSDANKDKMKKLCEGLICKKEIDRLLK